MPPHPSSLSLKLWSSLPHPASSCVPSAPRFLLQPFYSLHVALWQVTSCPPFLIQNFECKVTQLLSLTLSSHNVVETLTGPAKCKCLHEWKLNTDIHYPNSAQLTGKLSEENPRAIDHPTDVLVILNTNCTIACYKVLTQDGVVVWHIPDWEFRTESKQSKDDSIKLYQSPIKYSENTRNILSLPIVQFHSLHSKNKIQLHTQKNSGTENSNLKGGLLHQHIHHLEPKLSSDIETSAATVLLRAV